MGLLHDCLHDFLGMVFPTFCVACRGALSRGEEMVCTECIVKLPYTNYHLQRENPLEKRFWGKLPIEHAVAYLTFQKSGRVQRILHQLKYGGSKDLGALMGKWYGATLAQAGYHEHFDLVIPVPLHKAKRRQRGYNQAEAFADGLAEIMNLEHQPQALKRNVFTATQTKKARLERWQNVKAVFAVPEPDKVKGKRVLLVDDVITTGATLEACAMALLEAGCKSVSIAALAAA